jgi:hypothetical protein
MVKIIQNIAVTIFILSVVFMTFLAILSVWDVLQKDVLGKSLSTIGIMAFASLVVIVATRAIDNHQNNLPKPPMGGGTLS